LTKEPVVGETSLPLLLLPLAISDELAEVVTSSSGLRFARTNSSDPGLDEVPREGRDPSTL
jgi:hypothetical protein